MFKSRPIKNIVPRIHLMDNNTGISVSKLKIGFLKTISKYVKKPVNWNFIILEKKSNP